MKKTLILATSIACAMSAQAATTSLSLDIGSPSGSDTGLYDTSVDNDSTSLTVTRINNFAKNNSGGPGTIDFTITGLNIDGIGAADDTLTVSFDISGTTGATTYGFDFWDGAGTYGEWGINSDGEGGAGRRQINGVETMTVGFASAVVVLGVGGDGGYTATFDGWDTGSFSNTADITYTGGEAAFTAGPGGGGLGLITSDLTITAVPEPSSAALLGLGGLALILRRRK